MPNDHPSGRRVELTLPASGDSVPRIRRAVASLAQACGGGPRVVADVELAVSEACTSVVVPAAEPAAALRLHVVAVVADDTLEVQVRRAGGRVGAAGGDAGMGLGLALMAAVATSVQVADDGEDAAVALTFELGTAPKAGD